MANNIERLGVSFCEYVANKNDWIFREQPIGDIGIDAHMEFNDTDGETQRLLAIQIKSGESFFREKKDGNIIFRGIDDRQYNYWTTYPLPCIIVLYNPNDNTCIWQKLTNETIVKTNNGYRIAVPEKQVFLDDFSNDILKKYTNLPNYITNYNFLLSQKIFMEIIESGGLVKLHAKEWIHKTLGIRNVDLIVEHLGKIETYSYPYYFPYDSGEVVFQRLFPWADFSIDEEYYENSDYEQWLESENYYDDEEGKYFVIGDSFEEYRSSLPPIRGIDHCGEVSEFMLIMGLNDLGKSFLTVDRYTSMSRPYSNVKSYKTTC
ncbi:DUF4365 domain-containing protein [uncultured Ruminobacter sp.]|uniref:DUF4365 domain-containing protein n=1 Tax=uncultured Ruminobacter sp. TaxID=538947 RepID=UPI0025E2DE1C|nr:DUF4365 domain-containing protein [uncultured Ruminobacter sp.]